ncbi:hypothetical protein [Marinomonas sp.]|uniref:hypothetical protein n=1 Tax=Marinomonas sp. TaxID=1904862 RepID=UPI003F9B587A
MDHLINGALLPPIENLLKPIHSFVPIKETRARQKRNIHDHFPRNTDLGTLLGT